MTDKDLGPLPIPNQHTNWVIPGDPPVIYKLSNDAQGMRVTGAIDPSKAKQKILLLGDSFTYGVGVNDEQTFAYLLEDSLAKNGVPATVTDAGNPGKGTDYELRFFELRGASLRPDLTIVGFFSNDFDDNLTSRYYYIKNDGALVPRSFPMSVDNGTFRKLSHWLLSWSEAAQLIRSIEGKWTMEKELSRITFPGIAELISSTKQYSDTSSTALTALFLGELHKKVSASGSDFLVLYIPRVDEVAAYRRNGSLSTDEKTFRSLMGPEEHFLSFTKALADSGVPLEKLYLADGHWAAEAHELAASAMEREAENILQSRP
ncbi:MAG: SGNH/GDSL hydrolase family protein [Candidatus Liptonbacteria bacterium]|nr:SGNH/GDSL hydrolase family protein [Candidatus Liptonbacteria bacterium]